MKIIVQTLNPSVSEHGFTSYKVDESLDEVVAIVNSNANRTAAIAVATNRKPTLLAGQKTRVLIYRNDEPDETRTGCEVIEV
jgi:hypothetical protein